MICMISQNQSHLDLTQGELTKKTFFYEHFLFFSLSFFSLCNLQQEKDSPHENAKQICFVFLLSVEVFLEADASEF